jgi:DNA-binding Lrp family transcriptional regulator
MSIIKLDKTDSTILRALQLDGKISNVKLAEKVNLSESACLRRVKMLEDTGIIDRYATIVNPVSVGLPGNVFVDITLEKQQQEELDAFEKAISNVPEVMECYLMSGEFDYLLRVVVKDATDYERIHHESLTRLPGVARVRSSFTLRTVTKKTEIPLNRL